LKSVLLTRDRPSQLFGAFEVSERDRTHDLPTEAYVRGWRMFNVSAAYAVDPVCIYDRFGTLLYEWPEGYDPTYAEIRDVCASLY